MLPPIKIPELDPASPIDKNNDYVVLRQGLNDRKATVGQISSLNLGEFPFVPQDVLGSDILLLGRYVAPNTYENYISPVQKIGFIKGTVCWFWAASAPLYWSPVPNSGDRVLATVGGTQAYQNFGRSGTWVQPPHTLTAAEIPPHQHRFYMSYHSVGKDSDLGFPRAGSLTRAIARAARTETDGGGGEEHSHGNTWRPSAMVGILAIKDDLP